MGISKTNMDDFANSLSQARPAAFYKCLTRSDQLWAALQHICIVELITSSLRMDVNAVDKIKFGWFP